MSPLLISAGLQLLETFSSDVKIEDKEVLVRNTLQLADESRPFWARKTFWATVAAVLVPIVNKAAGLDLDITEVSAAITPLVAFVLGESWRKKGA